MWWWLWFSSLNSQILTPLVQIQRGNSNSQFCFHRTLLQFTPVHLLGKEGGGPSSSLNLNCWCSPVPKAICYILRAFPPCTLMGNTQPLSNDTVGSLMQPGCPLIFLLVTLGSAGNCSHCSGWQSRRIDCSLNFFLLSGRMQCRQHLIFFWIGFFWKNDTYKSWISPFSILCFE